MRHEGTILCCKKRRKSMESFVRRMTASLVQRGPDSEGVWAEGGVALGQRNLSIIDLKRASCFSPEALAVDEPFDPAPATVAWKEHLSGRRDWIRKLWIILMFQTWRARLS